MRKNYDFRKSIKNPYSEKMNPKLKPGGTVKFNFDGAKSIPRVQEYREHDGQIAEIVERLKPPLVDEEVVMYCLRFNDGVELEAWADELEAIK